MAEFSLRIGDGATISTGLAVKQTNEIDRTQIRTSLFKKCAVRQNPVTEPTQQLLVSPYLYNLSPRRSEFQATIIGVDSVTKSAFLSVSQYKFKSLESTY